MHKSKNIAKKAQIVQTNKSTNYLIYRINKRIESIFAKQNMKHKDIYSLFDEVNNGTPTRLECKAYEELRIRFRDLFYTLSIR